MQQGIDAPRKIGAWPNEIDADYPLGQPSGEVERDGGLWGWMAPFPRTGYFHQA